MPEMTNNLAGVFERKTNKYGKYYFSVIMTLDNNKIYEFFLFSSEQYWSGVSDGSTNGELMFAEVDTENELIKIGTWKKLDDGRIFIIASSDDLKYAFYGVPEEDKILLYDARPTSALERLYIQNNL